MMKEPKTTDEYQELFDELVYMFHGDAENRAAVDAQRQARAQPEAKYILLQLNSNSDIDRRRGNFRTPMQARWDCKNKRFISLIVPVAGGEKRTIDLSQYKPWEGKK